MVEGERLGIVPGETLSRSSACLALSLLICPLVRVSGGAGKGTLTDLPHSLMAGEPVWGLLERRSSGQQLSFAGPPLSYVLFF